MTTENYYQLTSQNEATFFGVRLSLASTALLCMYVLWLAPMANIIELLFHKITERENSLEHVSESDN